MDVVDKKKTRDKAGKKKRKKKSRRQIPRKDMSQESVMHSTRPQRHSCREDNARTWHHHARDVNNEKRLLLIWLVACFSLPPAMLFLLFRSFVSRYIYIFLSLYFISFRCFRGVTWEATEYFVYLSFGAGLGGGGEGGGEWPHACKFF